MGRRADRGESAGQAGEQLSLESVWAAAEEDSAREPVRAPRMAHWTRWLPQRVAQHAGSGDVLFRLGLQVAEQIDQLADQLAGPDPPGESFSSGWDADRRRG